MAEAMARAIGGDRVTALSAGLTPAGFIAEPTVLTLKTMGYSAKGLRSKGLGEIPGDSIDVVVSLLGNSGLNFLPLELGIRREGWRIADPFGEDETFYRHVARQIEVKVREILAEELAGELLTP